MSPQILYHAPPLHCVVLWAALQTDTFSVRTPDIGELHKVQVRKEKGGSDQSQDWHIARIVAEHDALKESTTHNFNLWLDHSIDCISREVLLGTRTILG